MFAYEVVFVRHGESEYNKKNGFTGWIDCDITEKGESQARRAAWVLQENGYSEFDIAHTSLLRRSIRSLNLILDELNLEWIPVCKSWRLNERHYGTITGMNKDEALNAQGWQRTFKVAPPKVDRTHPYWPGHHQRYRANIPEDLMPLSESLENVQERTLVYWHDTIVPDVIAGKRVLIAAHGNSVRGIMKQLENISDEEIVEYPVPNAVPFAYWFDRDFNVIKRFNIGEQ